MQRWVSKSPRKGLALVTTLMILFILTVIAFAICAIGIQNLNLVSGYRNSSMAYYAARAGISEAFYRIDNDNSYGTSATQSFTETLSNGESYEVNFVSGPFYSVNNLAGSGNVTDGSGDTIPKKFVSVISSSTVRGRTVRLKGIGRLGYPGDDYAIFTDGVITAGNITGDVRNNCNGITLSSITGTALTTAGAGSITPSGGSCVYNASNYPVPDLHVATIVSDAAGGANVHVCNNEAEFLALIGPHKVLNGGTVYVNVGGGNVTVNGGFDITNGARLFINGSLTSNGQINVSSGQNAIFCTGDIETNGASCSDSCSIISGGQIRFNGKAELSGFMYCNRLFDQNGNSSYTGNIMVRNGGFDGPNTSVVYDPQYMENLGQFFPSELLGVRILTMGQI